MTTEDKFIKFCDCMFKHIKENQGELTQKEIVQCLSFICCKIADTFAPSSANAKDFILDSIAEYFDEADQP